MLYSSAKFHSSVCGWRSTLSSPSSSTVVVAVGVGEELVLDARLEVVEAALALAAGGLDLLVRGAEADAQAIGDALRHVHREIGLPRSRLVTACAEALARDRRKRQLVRDERILGRRGAGKEALA